MVLKFRFFPVLAALVLLSACGGGGDLETETSTPYSPSAGLVVDGYLSIAKVVCDTNENGVADSGEPVTYTNTQGNYVFRSGCAFSVLASGGTNIDTNSAFVGQLRAPVGATVVTPLTTLVAAGMSQDQVIRALSLPPDTKLLTTDPAATDVNGLLNSSLYKKTLAVQLITEKITNLFTTLSEQAGYVSQSTATAGIYGEVAKAIAGQIQSGAPLITGDGLVSASTVNKLVAASVERMGLSGLVSHDIKKALTAAGGSATLPELVADAFANQAQRFLTTADTNLVSVASTLQNNKVVEDNVATAFRLGALDSKTTSAAITALKATIALKKQDSLIVSADQSRLVISGTTDLTAIGGSGTGALSFRVTSGSCTINGKTLTSSASEGTCTVIAIKASDESFEQASSESLMISVYLREQATLVAEAAQSNLYTMGRTTLSTKGGSGSGAVTYTITSGACTVSGSTLIASQTSGNCTVVAVKAGDAYYSQRSAQPLSIGISAAPQEKLVTEATQTKLFFDDSTKSLSTTLTSTGGSGTGAVTYAVTSGGCTLSGSLLTAPASIGTCTVVATKAGDSSFGPATSEPLSILVLRMTTATLVISAEETSLLISAQTNLSNSGGLGSGAVTYKVTSGSCSINGSTLTASASAGTCTVVATKAADAGWAQATSEALTFTISLRPQAKLEVAVESNNLFVTGQTTLSASGGTGSGAVSYSVTAGSGSCSISGSTLIASSSAGTCSVVASKAGDATYAQTISSPITITVQAAPVLPSTSPIDFEPAGRGAVFAWTTFENDSGPWSQIVTNPSKTGINTSDKVVMFTAVKRGNPWAGFQSAHKSDLGTVTLSTSNALVKMMVYKPVISDVGVKFASATDVTTGEVKVANTKINEWEQLTFNFCGRIGEVNDQIIFFPDFNLANRTSDTTSYLDNISFNACPAATVPTTVPEVPTALTANVISLYGDGYNTVTGTDTPKWGGMTTTITAETYAGNNVLKLAKFNYQGFTNTSPLDVSKHTSLHIDFWSQTATTIEVKLVSLTPTVKQQSIYIPINGGTWTSKDIPLSSFNIPDKTKFQQLVIAAANVGQTLYVDNVYFWK